MKYSIVWFSIGSKKITSNQEQEKMHTLLEIQIPYLPLYTSIRKDNFDKLFQSIAWVYRNNDMLK